MARQKGTANFSGTLEVLAGGPIDSRTVVPTLADLTTASNFPYAYVGMETYVVSEDKKYRLIGADVTQSSNWEEVGSGGDIDVDDALSSSSENPVQNKVIKGVLDKTFKTDDELIVGAAQDNDFFPFYSTGFSKQCRRSFSHIKATLKNYFDTLYSTIKTSEAAVQGGTDLSLVTTGEKYAWNNPSSVPIVANQFDKANIYSTTEKIVGCWTDGRPVYQKTVSFGMLPDTTTKEVNHNISNINEVVRVFGISNDSSGDGFQIIPLVGNGAGVEYQVSIKITKTKIICKCDKNMASFYPNTYITLQYTKTTDAANSFNYADENDYSTTEHIVGSWIDGKPLYQKVVDFGTGPNATAKSVAHGINNIATIVKMEIMGVSGSGSSSGGSLVAFALDSATLNSTGQKTFCFLQADKVTIRSDIDQSAKTFKVILKYTKTTD